MVEMVDIAACWGSSAFRTEDRVPLAVGMELDLDVLPTTAFGMTKGKMLSSVYTKLFKTVI